MQYFVVKGKSLTTRRGIKNGGDEVIESDFGADSDSRLAFLAERGYITSESKVDSKKTVENKKAVKPK